MLWCGVINVYSDLQNVSKEWESPVYVWCIDDYDLLMISNLWHSVAGSCWFQLPKPNVVTGGLPVVNFTKILWAAFELMQTVSTKKLFKTLSWKDALIMLEKLTPVVNIINILWAAFMPKLLQSQTVCREKLLKMILYKEATRKMSVKLTPVVNFINVKRTNFSYERCFL